MITELHFYYYITFVVLRFAIITVIEFFCFSGCLSVCLSVCLLCVSVSEHDNLTLCPRFAKFKHNIVFNLDELYTGCCSAKFKATT